jgi:hypothetical protein
MIAYSSWPVAGQEAQDKHPVHKGVPKTASCGQTTLDDFVFSQQLSAVSLIKIDTDGHEFAVLAGARRCLGHYRPIIIFEACAYLMRPPAATFDGFLRLFGTKTTLFAMANGSINLARGFAERRPAGGVRSGRASRGAAPQPVVLKELPDYYIDW